MKKLLILTLFLSACAGEPEPRVGSQAWLNAQDPQTRGQYYADLCTGQGFQPGGEDFYNCVQDASANLKLHQLRDDFSERALR